jgi:hypothetical protein
MSPEAARLRQALVEAFPGYMHRMIEERGLPEDPSVESAVAEGRDWLAEALDVLLGRPAVKQDRSPMQLFREALRIPTTALDQLGVAPVDRDPVDVALFPEDRYGFAPAGSQDLGEEPWRAHVEWGIAKAETVAGMVPTVSSEPPGRPVSALVGMDLMDRSKIEAAAHLAGYNLTVLRNPAAVVAAIVERPPAVAFVDLTHRSADEAIRRLGDAGVRTIAFGPHVDDIALIRARSLGANDAVPRSRFFRDLSRWFPTPV